LNRYAYALNNPLKYGDPSGHYVEFVGGWGTDQQFDEAFNRIVAGLQETGLKAGRDYGFFDWGSVPVGGQAGASALRNVSDMAPELARQIAGKNDVTLVGHSKGGDLVLEYLAQVGEGKIAANPAVRAAITLNAPIDNAF